jgi:hypothetical protein
MIEHRREVGAWLTLDRGLYALPSHPYPWRRQAKAAELSVEGAGLSHRAAAVLHGVVGFRPGGLDLTVPRSAKRTSGLAIVHRSDHFDVVRRDSITVTTVERTMVDLCGHTDGWTLERAVDDVLLTRKTSIEALEREIERASRAHAPSIAVLRRLVDVRGEGYVPPSNELEAGLYALLESAVLPAFVRQAPLPWWPPARQRVDALIPRWKLIVERAA